MDVVTHYSPPSTETSPVHVTSQDVARGGLRRSSLTSLAASLAGPGGQSVDGGPAGDGRHRAGRMAEGEHIRRTALNRLGTNDGEPANTPASSTFSRSVQISLNEPVGSMSISPANRDVVLAARKGLFIIDLDNLYDQPRFLAHLTTWVPADIQWNPHPFRANWVASTSNNKLLVWDLDRPEAERHSTRGVGSFSSVTSLSGSSPSLASLGLGITSPFGLGASIPQPIPAPVDAPGPSSSRLSAISHVLSAHTRAITDINWSPFHPEVLASCGIDTWTWAWDLRDPSKPKQGYSAWNSAMTQVKWNRATPHRLATSCDNKVLIWDDRKGALPLATIEAHENRIYGVDWSRDLSSGASRLVTCSLDGAVKWWDLDAPSAQQAIGQRQLITDPETVIKTSSPVWRARHLPFGQGVMTLPQRGDTSLSMWSKSKADEPVHRFSGHRDIVKEYLFRTQGGEDRTSDSRKFQLITWSKDQTLRLWPITEEMTASVSHQPGLPITVRQTRVNAPNVTYRNPPARATSAANPQNLTPAQSFIKTPISSAEATPSTSLVGIAPPAEATRTLFSGSYKGPASSSNSSGMQKAASPSASLSPIGRILTPNSFGRQDAGPSVKAVKKAASATQMAVRDNQRRKLSIGQTSMHARVQDLPVVRPASSSTRHSYGSRRSNPQTAEHQTGRVMSSRAATRNYMTRGTATHPAGPVRSAGVTQTKKANYVDAVGWIAGVRINQETMPSKRSSSQRKGDTEEEKDPRVGEQPFGIKAHRPTDKDAAQLLSEEIMSVSNNVLQASFERVDVSARTCTASCYGPWGAKYSPCFVRIVFTFPSSYPAKKPKFELEHNASVALKTRAYLLRNLSTLLSQKASADPPEPSMEACLHFLIGDTFKDHDEEADRAEEPNEHPFWLPGVEEQEEDEEEKDEARVAMKMPPRRCGATFAANGILVTFNASKNSARADSMHLKHALDDRPPSSAAHSGDANHLSATALGRSRFLQSYSALAGAMTSLARLAKEGMLVQDLDVVQLMSDESFFSKRLQQSGQRSGAGGHRGAGSLGPSASRMAAKSVKSKLHGESAAVDVRIAALTVQDRLGLGDDRSRTRSRSGRARSASPASARNTPQPVLSGTVSPFPGPTNTSSAASVSQVFIWDVSAIVKDAAPTQKVAVPPFNRRRSASTPLSPANTLTPRTEFPFAPFLVPASATPPDGTEQSAALPASIASSLRERGSMSGYRIREVDSDDDSFNGDEQNADELLERVQRDALHPTVESFFDTLIWLIPFASIYLFLDIMIQQQYAMQPKAWNQVKRMSEAAPFLTILVYFTTVRADRINRIVLQAGLFLLGVTTGSAFLYIYIRSSQPIVVRRTAPLATLWIYAIARLELALAVACLSIIYGYVRYVGLDLFA